MIKHVILMSTFVLFSFCNAGTTRAQAVEEQKPADQMTIAEIMVETNKKPTQLLLKVQKGKASETEKQRLVDLYKSMAAQSPPRGDQEDWKQRTTLLIDAAEKALRSEDGADRLLRKASNCMACHKEHKPEE